uniref:HMG box domain-containing protein n=1 Tax=Macrostomum lignano TaxID=282301 RepID=A0A1I8H382_9PLAT
VLGGTCAALSGLMILLLVSAGQDTIELLLSFRQRAEDKWRRQKQRESPEQRPLGLISHFVRLFDTKKQKNRDRELHRMLTKAAVDRKRAAAAGWKQMHPARKPLWKLAQSPQSPQTQLALKAQREAQADKLRALERQETQAAKAAPPRPSASVATRPATWPHFWKKR